MQHWCLRLAWEGTAYVGWQAQPNGRSIQQVCEDAVQELLGGERVRLRAAGRTDAGVHALEQVVHLRCQTRREAGVLRSGLNALLPADISCLSVESVPANFDPRSWTRRKTYRYRILQRAVPCPFRRRFSWHRYQPLDLGQMKIGAKALEGRNDYSSFRAQGCGAASPVRTIETVEIRDLGDEIHIEVTGEAFLRHQVRIMAGTLVDVGSGRRSGSEIADILHARKRCRAGPTAPSAGLTLVSVEMGDGPRRQEGGS